MTEFATINGNRIVGGSICFPHYGLWTADLKLASAVELPVTSEIKIANLEISGHLFRATNFAGSQSARVLGGRGGLRKSVPSQAYYNAKGIKYSMILGDVSSLVGERVSLVTDRVWGQYFTRKEGLAERVFRQLLGDVWYADNSGIIQCQERTNTSQISSDFTVTKFSGMQGAVQVATEDLASWMPGRSFRSVTMTRTETISMSTIHFDDKGTLRIDVLTATGGET